MAFEDLAGYFIVFVIFILGFMPIMNTVITTALPTAPPVVQVFLSMIVPFILVVFIVAFFLRLRGQKPFGEGSAW